MTDPIKSLAKCIASLMLVLQALESLMLVLQALESLIADEALPKIFKGRERANKLMEEHHSLQNGVSSLTEQLSQPGAALEDPLVTQTIIQISQRTRLLHLKGEILSVEIRKVKIIHKEEQVGTVSFADVDMEQGLSNCSLGTRQRQVSLSTVENLHKPESLPLQIASELPTPRCSDGGQFSMLPAGPIKGCLESGEDDPQHDFRLPVLSTAKARTEPSALISLSIHASHVMETHSSPSNGDLASDIAQSLHTYLNPTVQDPTLPTFDLDNLSEALKHISTEMHKVQSHANAFEEAAVTARSRVSRLHSILKSCQNLSVPLVRMPEELLAMVFEYCVRADTSGHAFSKYAMPWVLTQTCRRWRTIALCTPSLWSIVRVNTKLMSTLPYHDSSLDMLRTWLERSQKLPIYCLAIFAETSPLSFNTRILDLLISHSTRWLSVDLTFGTQSELYFQLSTVDPYLPLLHSSRLNVTILDTAENIGRASVHWNTPNLTEAVFLVTSDSPDHTPDMVPSWSQLEEFAWIANTPKAFMDIAPAFALLRYCHLNISRDTVMNGMQRCTLPNLRHFDVFGPFRSVLAILNCLSLPALHDLDMDFHESIGTAADHLLTSLGRLQARSRCHLRHISAPFPLFSSPNAPSLVEKFGPVVELRILLSTEEDNQQAIDNFRNTNIFRQLTMLHLLFREQPDSESTLFSEVVSVVEARRSSKAGVSALENLSLDLIRSSTSTDDHISAHLPPFQRLLQLEQGGLLLLGAVVGHKWCSIYGDAHWNSGDFQRAARRWARFGYSDWLYEWEIDYYLKVRTLFRLFFTSMLNI
ncbi:hypothetical protein Moror_4306 [Moniliophthora roreri MCA 2997]|uniref:Uncharacterized protein n=1 Tax=Moniliophthora roreri (strain MCA 2997) TaxID=1381753 RepID=V2WKV0_MONRO|nr:hypothetical protein Moror_4306 [Moniliophthora roreri MCA 2997]